MRRIWRGIFWDYKYTVSDFDFSKYSEEVAKCS